MPRYAKSLELFAEARAAIPAGVSSSFRGHGDPCPLFFDRAAGCRLIDADGNSYVDYVLGLGPCILGHAPREVTEAVARVLDRGQLFAGQHAGELELARRIQDLVPSAERVRFASSGSEAVQAALRVARAATGRTKVVKFEGHYHGWLDSIFVSVAPPGEEPSERAPYRQSIGQSESAVQDVAVLPWNDLEPVAAYLARHADETAALLMEPILCNTGVILPRPGYLEGVRALCDGHGVVLIFDEVITGFRIGPGGAQARLGVTPDITVLGKALGAGFPISAIAGRRDIMQVMERPGFVHGGTYNANLMSVAAANAALAILAGDGGRLYQPMQRRGERLMEGLRALDRDTKAGLHVQGLGTVFNTCFGATGDAVDYRSYQLADAGKQRAFVTELQDRGVRITSRGTWFLSTAHADADVEHTLTIAAAALRAVDAREAR